MIESLNLFIKSCLLGIGYGGILKQKVNPDSPKQIVRFHSGVWTKVQSNYITIKKEILSIVLCVVKFQTDLLNKKFLIRIDCKSAKHVLEKRRSKHCIKTSFCPMAVNIKCF